MTEIRPELHSKQQENVPVSLLKKLYRALNKT